MDPILFLPSLFYHTLDPLFKFAIPVFLDRGLGITQNEDPLLYIFGEWIFNIIELIVMMPLETIRLRLQCQIRAIGPEERSFSTLVALSPIAYSGIWDCAYRIFTEEGHRKGFYRGFKARFLAYSLVAIVQYLAID